jgi:cell division protein FtsL
MTSVAFAVSRRSVRVRRAIPAHSVRPRARHARAAVRATSFELRSFVGASAAIAVAFVLALAYLAGSTGVASVGYEAQRLQSQRDELRRQNSLLELELARLDSPARIEAQAQRLGLVRLAYIPVVPADPLTARR